MSIFSCLADCARLDPLTDCTGLALDGRPVQQARSPSCGGKEESTCDETCIVDSQHSNSPASLYERVRKDCNQGGSPSSSTARSEAEQDPAAARNEDPDPTEVQREVEVPPAPPKILAPAVPLHPPTPNPMSIQRPDRRYDVELGMGDYAPVDRSSLPTLRSMRGARNRSHQHKRQFKSSKSNLWKGDSVQKSTTSDVFKEQETDVAFMVDRAPIDGSATEKLSEGVKAIDEQHEMSVEDRQVSRELDSTTSSGERGILKTPARPPRMGRKTTLRSASMGTILSDGNEVDESENFRSTPGLREFRPASTPGRIHPRRARLMARRVVAKWDDHEERSNMMETPERTRRLVSTSVRRLRMSEDGKTVRVHSEKGDVDHELALDELLEVHGTPSRKRVVLRGKSLELQIAFDGENVAFDQFRNTLVVPDENNDAGVAEEEKEDEDIEDDESESGESQESFAPASTGAESDVFAQSPSNENFAMGEPCYADDAAQSDAGSPKPDRIEVGTDSTSTTDLHVSPRSVTNLESPSGASCISDAMSQFPPGLHGHHDPKAERVLPSPTSIAHRYLRASGSSSQRVLSRRAMPSRSETIKEVSPTTPERSVPAPERACVSGARAGNASIEGPRIITSSRSGKRSTPAQLSCREQSAGGNGSLAPEVGNGVVQRMAAKLSMKNADAHRATERTRVLRHVDPEHDRPRNMQVSSA